MKAWTRVWPVVFVALVCASAMHAETLPPAPAHYFNDYAHLITATTASTLDRRLEQFERDTSNQILVAIYPKMDSASSVEDYTVRIAQSWHVGQKSHNNGAVLFVFVAEHQLYIQVGYGLEGALTDALCFNIIEHEIKPRFRSNDYAGGLAAGVDAMIAAAKGEYHGTGRTVDDAVGRSATPHGSSIGIILIVLLIIGANAFRARRRVFGSGPRRWGGGTWFGPGGGGYWGGGGGGDWGGGGSSGGGGFSGGGGSFGGGGAGGKW